MKPLTVENGRSTTAESRFEWPLCYEAENFILERIDAFTQQNSFARILASRMRDETGTLFLIGRITCSFPLRMRRNFAPPVTRDDPLADAPDAQKQLWHPEAMLPRVLIAATNAKYPLALGDSGSDSLFPTLPGCMG